jgi:hypothetical protein
LSKLTVTTDLSGTIDRQDLANMWSQGALDSINTDDLSPAFTQVVIGSGFSDAPVSTTPGKLFYHKANQSMYVFTDALDVLDNGEPTGVSLWLAIGPDIFETACLAAEPIPAGAVVEPLVDRWVQVFRPKVRQFSESLPTPIGINQSHIPNSYEKAEDGWAEGETTASGAWFRVGIDGILRGLYLKPEAGVSEGQFIVNNAGAVIPNYVGVMSGEDVRTAGSLGGRGNTATGAGAWTVGMTMHAVTVDSGYSLAYFYTKWLGTGVHWLDPDNPPE